MPSAVRSLLRTSRPRFWIYLAGPWILGSFTGAQDGRFFLHPAFWIGFAYCLLPANLLVYGVNDWFDLETDRLNAKKSGAGGGYEDLLDPSRYRGIAITIAAMHIPFVALAVGTAGDSRFLPVSGVWACFLFTGIGYSAPPVRAKARPVVDSIFNVLYACPAFAAFLAAGNPVADVRWEAVLAAWFWCMAMHAFSAVPDIDADRRAGLSTVATMLGGRATIVACGILYGAAAIFGAVAAPWTALRYGLPVLGAGYLAFMFAALRALPGNDVFAVYRRFPVWNSLAGFAITMLVLWSRWPELRP